MLSTTSGGKYNRHIADAPPFSPTLLFGSKIPPAKVKMHACTNRVKMKIYFTTGLNKLLNIK
jgi:hypothetical protein